MGMSVSRVYHEGTEVYHGVDYLVSGEYHGKDPGTEGDKPT